MANFQFSLTATHTSCDGEGGEGERGGERGDGGP